MPSASMSTMRACGSNPPRRPSAYFRVPALTIPCRTPTEPRLPMPRGLPSSLPSTLKRSLPLSSMTNRGRRSRNSGSMYLSRRSSGSRMWPSASITLYARVIGNPSEGNRTAAILLQPRHGRERHPPLGSVTRRLWCYFAAAGNAGSLPMSRMSCWMMTVALRFATICFMRSIEATVAARSTLKLGTPPLS
jgi:hypothetical protein